ncbi:GTPase/DUF3482 domain-containing protein [Oligoflexus tunisiensis]|uniref:GTPase/DUF3482 domain-containing protein n=1 Tax=Oligoflexus tunisiensis TaxID=708132 RepID=UPI00114CA727|nr:GTPase/DUF3482 domain-containing protein [Oligoflexus tunisiensis]
MKFAVVGRSNKGKSSIVATLVENDEILIAPTPRTTQISQEFALKVGERTLFSLIDTPGFEEAPAALEWLKQEPVPAHQRRQRVQAFYDTFQGSPRFTFECELLKPILEGAAILYVVDASHPYRPNFEAEFEILQWTGEPSLALLNQTGDGRYVADWQAALGQYFRKTLIFNAHTARFEERMRILEELRFLSDAARPILDEAMELLKTQHQSRLRAASFILAEFICEAILYRKKVPVKDESGVSEQDKERLLQEFQDHIRKMERESRRALAQVFQFKGLDSEEAELNPKAQPDDLFGRETWEFLGLSRGELIITGTAAGALAGGTIDASVGGASFMVGTGVGAMLGSLGTGYLAFSDPQLAGFKLARRMLTIGPLKSPNFPWILLDRGLLFMISILNRTHAQRGRLLVDEKHGGPTARLSKTDKRMIAWVFQKVRWMGRTEGSTSRLATEIRKAMEQL